MFEATIPKSEHTNIMASFWAMMRECENTANNNRDIILKQQVECWYQQWNLICPDKPDLKPQWSK